MDETIKRKFDGLYVANTLQILILVIILIKMLGGF